MMFPDINNLIVLIICFLFANTFSSRLVNQTRR